MSSPTVLTIAGSDSGGGAGIQADTKTIQVHGCFATNVVTALTAQNTVGVQGVHEVPSDFVKQQMKSVLGDLPPKAIKTGMLASSNVIRAIIEELQATYSEEDMPPMIIDPVMISTSNHTLLPSDAIGELCFGLLPLARLITPNIQETELLLRCLRAGKNVPHHSDVVVGDLVKEQESGTGGRIQSIGQMVDAGKEIAHILQAKDLTVLVKGGHLPMEKTSLKKALHALASDTHMTVTWKGESSGADEEQEGFIEVLHAYRDQLQNESKKDEEKYVVDVLIEASGSRVNLFVAPAIISASTHGTGCTLSAAIASNLALGKHSKLDRDVRCEAIPYLDQSSSFLRAVVQAVSEGIDYTQYAIVTAEAKGEGHGPLNHGCIVARRALMLASSSDPHPFVSHLLRSTSQEWQSYVKHPFVQQLGKGTLDPEAFRHYIIQDWHYLRNYARAHSLGAYKSTSFTEIQAFSEIALHIAKESEMHVQFCTSFGVSLEDLQQATESPSNSAYSQYILDIGAQGDVTELLVAVFSCLLGYGEVGLYLKRKLEDGTLEQRMMVDPPSSARLARLTKIWSDCVKLEAAFWQMGLDRS
ncbi:hypothetical protein QFC22_001431 [Naganishia vaughanmartiniae]|uniref:Uncharacterized protein n=1 Tax=Naganishia vaughanmartiniae TaxID=1424756 RepID=A0ACC2XJL2_9TREE|nr:hypothetical protein QFC22_001431 [Naganishia vaughanmartiniae]